MTHFGERPCRVGEILLIETAQTVFPLSELVNANCASVALDERRLESINIGMHVEVFCTQGKIFYI